MPPLVFAAVAIGLGYYGFKALKRMQAHVREDLEKVRNPAPPEAKTLKKDPATGEYRIDG